MTVFISVPFCMHASVHRLKYNLSFLCSISHRLFTFFNDVFVLYM